MPAGYATIMRRAAALVLLVLAGCGGGSDEEAAEREERPSGLSAEEREAGDVAVRYFRAVAAKDWPEACATRTREERRELARIAGRCEAGMKAAFSSEQFEIFGNLRVGDVRIRGDVAGIDLVQPGQTKPALKAAAVRDGGAWRLESMPDDEIP
jgi:hypothetical protein